MPNPLTDSLDRAYRDEWSRSVAILARRTGDLNIAEDCVQDAFESAMKSWQKAGVPENVGAWIRTTAWRRFFDGTRSAKTQAAAFGRLAQLAETEAVESEIRDSTLLDRDELSLLFYCAHPSLDKTAQVMLMLRITGGLTPREIAAAFMLDKEAVRTRLLRAKRKLKVSRAPLSVPAPHQLRDRVNEVLAGLYLMYNEAYLASFKTSTHRSDVAAVSLRLASRLAQLLPNEPETHGLIALLLYTEARLPSRSPEFGLLVPLCRQDRNSWRRDLITLANRHLAMSGRLRAEPGVYAIQAAISGLHCDAQSIDHTDWKTILGLYDRLLQHTDDPIAALNRIVVVARICAPATAMRELERLKARKNIAEHYLYHAVRGEICELMGDAEAASASFFEAAQRTQNDAVRRTLSERQAH